MRQVIAAGFALVAALCGSAHATAVVYTLYAVSDGQLGSQTFTSSPVTLTFQGDTSDIGMQTAGGVVTYRIDQGRAKVAVTIAGNTTVAHISPGQVYVHWDVQNAIVGFGSYGVGPLYPATLSCGNGTLCTFGPGAQTQGWGQILMAIADMAAEPLDDPLYSPATQALATTLAKPTLLTGYIGACAPGYVFGTSASPCASPPATPIHTDQGDFYLQDQGENGKGMFTVQYVPDDD